MTVGVAEVHRLLNATHVILTFATMTKLHAGLHVERLVIVL